MKRKMISILLIGLVCISALAGCKGKGELQTVRLNEVVHSIFYAPQYVALEKGFFEEEGLSIEMSIGQGADKSMTALLSGNADIGLMGPEASIYVLNEGQKNYAINIAQLTQRAGNFLIGREPVPDFDWQNVKGKSIIGGRPGGMPQMVLEYILKKNNLIPYEDMEIITNLAFTATAGSFVSGTGDYTVEFEPSASTIENEGRGYVIASLGTSSGKVPYTNYMATKEYIEKNPEAIQKFTNAIYKGQLWVKDHSPEEIAEVIKPQFVDTDQALLAQIVKRYKDQDTWKYDPVFEEKSLNLLQNILESAGELDKRVDYNTLANTDFAKKAIEKIEK